MDSIGVLMTHQVTPYLEAEVEKRFKLFKLWQYPSMAEFSERHSDSIQAAVGDPTAGVDGEMIDSLPGLAIVATCSVGFDNIDLRKCRERGIRVTNTPDVLTDDVADLAIGLILGVLRRICASDGFLRRGLWKNGSEFPLTTRFSGKSVGIVGLGRIGSAIAKRAHAFGCKISYFSRSEKPCNYQYYSDLVELASNCEILVVSCALTEQTHHIIDRRVMDALGPRGVLINIGRGLLVDECELVSALREGRLGGAGLDVFEKEPEVPVDLFGLENVVIVPHIGTDTVETSEAMADLVVRNLEAYALNKPLLTPVL